MWILVAPSSSYVLNETIEYVLALLFLFEILMCCINAQNGYFLRKKIFHQIMLFSNKYLSNGKFN